MPPKESAGAPKAQAEVQAATITFNTHAEEVLVLHAAVENKHSERKTKRSILNCHLLPAFGDLALEAIGPRQIAAYKAEKLKPSDSRKALTPKTVNNHLTVLHECLVLAKEWGRLAVVPTVGFLRVSIYDGVIDVPKGGRTREVPMGDELRAAFRELPSRFAGGLVWPGEGGRNLTKGEAKWPLWRACKRAGLRRIGWRVLRHTFASHLVMRGVPLKGVQELLGHASIKMTMRYAYLAPDVSREAVKLLDAPAIPPKASGAA